MNEGNFRDCINALYNKLYKTFADCTEELENKGVHDGNAHHMAQKMALDSIIRFLTSTQPNLYGPFHKKFATEMLDEFLHVEKIIS